jgi:hypothetical protein
MKPITLEEAEKFDIDAHYEQEKKGRINDAIKTINYFIETRHPQVKIGGCHVHSYLEITHEDLKELKEMYAKNGFKIGYHPANRSLYIHYEKDLICQTKKD